MTKNKKSVLLFLALLLVCLCCFCSCKETPVNGENASMLLVVGDAEYNVDISGKTLSDGLLSVLELLKAEGKLDYSTQGTMLTKVGALEQDASAGKYLFIYTDVVEDYDVSVYASETTYKGKTLASAGVGASSMHIQDGCTVLIDYVTWG